MKTKQTTKQKICPRCLEIYAGYPALSRRDNRTDICSDCGTKEALMDYFPLSKIQNKDSFAVELLREKTFQNSLKKHQFKNKFEGWLTWKKGVTP